MEGLFFWSGMLCMSFIAAISLLAKNKKEETEPKSMHTSLPAPGGCCPPPAPAPAAVATGACGHSSPPAPAPPTESMGAGGCAAGVPGAPRVGRVRGVYRGRTGCARRAAGVPCVFIAYFHTFLQAG